LFEIETNHVCSKYYLLFYFTPMKPKDKNSQEKWTPEKSEEAMIEGIIEGSPDAIGVAVIRMDCGCRKMAAVDKDGEPASEVIMYRDRAESICDQCKEDNGAYTRIKVQFIHWVAPGPEITQERMIVEKVLGIKVQ
jgi:sugar (pentulose or hexulose) kinase